MIRRFLAMWEHSLAFDLGRYVIAAGLAFLIFWVWGRERFRHRLIQGEYPHAEHIRRELLYSASTALIFSIVGVFVGYGKRAGIFHIGEASQHGAVRFATSLVALIVLHDAYFYWTHRAMHHPLLYKTFHRVHHRSTNPSPWAAYAFAPGEAIVEALFVPIVTLVLPVAMGAMFAFLAFMIVRNVMGHLGLELFPKWFIDNRLLAWTTTTTHHSMHHRFFTSNYGLYFTFWDRVMGTTHKDYEKTFAEVASHEPPSKDASPLHGIGSESAE